MELTMQVSKPVTLEIKEMMEVSISVELHVIINIMHIILIIHIEVTSGDQQRKRRSRNETFNASIEVTSGDRSNRVSGDNMMLYYLNYYYRSYFWRSRE